MGNFVVLLSVHVRLRPLNSGSHRSLRPPTSAITAWVVEKADGVLDGNPTTWDTTFHLQHLTTRQYLQLGPPPALTASLTPDRTAPASLFRFHPLASSKRKGDRVLDKAYVRIQHVLTGSWLHTDRSRFPSLYSSSLPCDIGQREYERRSKKKKALRWSRAQLHVLSGPLISFKSFSNSVRTTD